MTNVSTKVWGPLEKWTAWVFLIAGVLLGIATINEGMIWAANMETPEIFEFAGFLGMVVSYVGLLGLYPRLAGRQRQLAQVGLGLLLIPVIVIIIDLISVALGYGPPFGATLATAAFTLFALGVVLYGVIILRTKILANVIGLSLVAYGVGWFILIGASQLYELPPPAEAVVISSAIMAVSLLAVGYMLQTETDQTDRPGATPT